MAGGNDKMEKTAVLEGIKKLRVGAKARKFTQTIDLVINIQHLDVKTLKINDTIELPSGRGRAVKVLVVADGEPALQAKNGGADLVMGKQNISEWAGQKKEIRKLANEYEWFVIQAQLMQSFASVFGALLGPRGKMPVPKDILTPTENPAKLIARLRNSVKVKIKDQPIIHAPAGVESMSDDELAENILAIYNTILAKLENGTQNVGSMYIKTTMGAPVKLA